jgi:hypothetical protein
MVSIFLSHSSADKEKVREISELLKINGIKTWIDEAEIKPGEMLLQKISNGIKEMDYLAVFLSQNSVKSNWVMKELSIAMSKEIIEGKIKVLPILIEDCEIPNFLKDKKYIDFRDKNNIFKELNSLMQYLKKIPENKEMEQKKEIPQKEMDLEKFKIYFNYAYHTMDLSTSQAKDVAFYLMKRSEKRVEKFKELFNYAYRTMDMSAVGATNFAIKWINDEIKRANNFKK